jgi:hypothetical protein
LISQNLSSPATPASILCDSSDGNLRISTFVPISLSNLAKYRNRPVGENESYWRLMDAADNDLGPLAVSAFRERIVMASNQAGVWKC